MSNPEPYLYINNIVNKLQQKYQVISQLLMKQVSLMGSKQSQDQPKSRKLISGKSGTLQQRQSSKPFQRMKSNDEAEQSSKLIQTKPKSSLGRRPASSHKYTESINSAATTSGGKNQEEIKQTITTIFNHSKKLQNFLMEKKLNEENALQMLLKNQLFILSLVSLVSNISPEEMNKCVERSCIHKLDRILAMQKQKTICQKIENRIGQLIDKRIKDLSNF